MDTIKFLYGSFDLRNEKGRLAAFLRIAYFIVTFPGFFLAAAVYFKNLSNLDPNMDPKKMSKFGVGAYHVLIMLLTFMFYLFMYGWKVGLLK